MRLNIDKYNDDIQGWGQEAEKDMHTAGGGLGILHRKGSPSPGASLPKVKARFRYSGGLITVISFSVPRHLYYVHKGAGKGRGGDKGSRWVDKYGSAHTTNPSSLGKAGTDGRVEKPFINQVLNGTKGINQLADIAANSTGDMIMGNILIK